MRSRPISPRGPRKRALLAATLLVGALVAASGQAQGEGLASGGLASLRGQARARSYEARPVALADGTKWIWSEAEVEAVFDGSLEELVGLLTDYEASPRVFSGIDRVRLRSNDGRVAVTEQRSVVRALGFEFATNLVFRNELRREGPGRVSLSFEMIDGDGSVRESRGGWSLEAVELPSGPAVHVSYRCSLLAAQRFPLQLQIMRSFGRAEFEKTVRQLGKALTARTKRRA